MTTQSKTAKSQANLQDQLQNKNAQANQELDATKASASSSAGTSSGGSGAHGRVTNEGSYKVDNAVSDNNHDSGIGVQPHLDWA